LNPPPTHTHKNLNNKQQIENEHTAEGAEVLKMYQRRGEWQGANLHELSINKPGKAGTLTVGR
jgi:hypothetical protein